MDVGTIIALTVSKEGKRRNTEMRIYFNGFVERAMSECPNEACGFIFSHKPYGPEEEWHVFPVKNISETSEIAWDPDKKELQRVKKQALKSELTLIGNIHSHPYHGHKFNNIGDLLLPSKTDLKFARKYNDIIRGILVVSKTKVYGIKFHDKFGNIISIQGKAIFQLKPGEMGNRILEMQKKGWLPTAENINALPEPVRQYIYDLETNADPPSMIQDNALLRENCKALEIKVERECKRWGELRKFIEGDIQKNINEQRDSPTEKQEVGLAIAQIVNRRILQKMQSIEEGEE